MTVAEMQAAIHAGDLVAPFDKAEPWKLTHVSRATFHRWVRSPDCPPGLCLQIGRRRLLSLPVFLRMIGAEPSEGCTGRCHE